MSAYTRAELSRIPSLVFEQSSLNRFDDAKRIDNTVFSNKSVYDEFTFVAVSPTTFRSHFEFKENCFPDPTISTPDMFQYDLDMFVNPVSPTYSDDVSFMDPFCSIVLRDDDSDEESVCSSNGGYEIPNVFLDARAFAESKSEDSEEEISRDGLWLQPAQTENLNKDHQLPENTSPLMDGNLPTSALLHSYGKSYEKVGNFDDFQEEDDDVFIEDESVSNDSNGKMFHTPPNNLKEDEEFYSFLSSRSRKIARNMSVGRKDKTKEQDFGYVQPKKLFLD